MINNKYTYKSQYRKYKISNILQMGVLSSNTPSLTKNYSFKTLSSKNYKLKLVSHIIILACFDLF